MCKMADLSGCTTVLGGKRSLSYPLHRVTFLLLRLQWPETSKLRLERHAEMMQMCWQSSSAPRPATVTGSRYFKTCNTRHTNRGESVQQVRHTATSYGIPYTALCDRHLPAFLRGWAGVCSTCKHKRSCCSNISPQPPSDITDGGTSPTELKTCWKRSAFIWNNINFLLKSTSKTFNPSVRFG